jgi:hypothetical protein
MTINSLHRALVVLACALSALAPASQARTTSQEAQAAAGLRGITETVAKIMSREHGRIDFPRSIDKERMGPDRSHLPQNPLSPAVAQWPPSQDVAARILGLGDKPPTSSGPFILGPSWEGANSTQSGFIPPDTQGDVGPSNYLVCVNGRIKVYDKAGVLGSLNTTTDNFFNSVRGASTSDPRVRYDRISQRWFVVMIDVLNNSNRILVGVSNGPTITAATVWTFFGFAQDSIAPIGNAGQFADWPTLGVDANALYIGCNMFSGNTYVGTSAWVIRKSSVTGGGPLFATAFRNLTGTSTGAGLQSPMGVDNIDPAATVGYFIGPDNASFGKLVVRRVSDPGGTPTMSANMFITVPSTSWPFAVPQVGSPSTMDSLDDRLFSAQIRTNRITGQQSIWTSHNVAVNSAGVASSAGDRVASRWYQITNFGTTPTLAQSGTVFDPAASNPRHYWMSTTTMSGQGHALIGMGYSGLADHPSVAYATRLSSDALGTMQAPAVVLASGFVYGTTAGAKRWGDYSMTSLDPSDDMSFWSIQEYCSASNVWAVRVFKVVAPPPATISTVVPNTAQQGQTLNVVVSGSVVAGSGFYDPGPGYNRLQASFSGTGITVNSVTFNSPTQATLNITVAGGATVGLRNLTITNPDGQSVTANNAFTVTTGTVTVPPTSFNTVRGILVAGTLADLLASDDAFIQWKAGPILSLSEKPIDIIVDGTSPLATPSTIVFQLEGRVNNPNIAQTISLFNYVTSSWEPLDVRTATTSDTVVMVTVSTNASRFVDPGTLAMRARFGYKTTGPILTFPWVYRGDQAVWLVTP